MTRKLPQPQAGSRKRSPASFSWNCLSSALVAFGALELGPQVVEEQGADDLEDVALAGVVAADLPALLRLHDALEERAENGGRDARPVEARAGQQAVAHVAVEVGEAEVLGEELAVDVGEGGQSFVEVLLALLGRRVEHVEEPRQVQAEVGAVPAVRFRGRAGTPRARRCRCLRRRGRRECAPGKRSSSWPV